MEQVLIQQSSLNLFVQAFLSAKANSFENILEPLYKILRISPQVACGIAVPNLFPRLLDRLAHPKAVVRLNLLRILRAIFDAYPERNQLVFWYGISEVVVKISEEDPAVLVKELAKEILDAFEESDSEAAMSDQEDEDEYSLGVAGPGRGDSNGYNSFASAGDFFGQLQLHMRVNMLNTSSPSAGHLEVAPGSAQQSLQNGVFSSLDIHGNASVASEKDKDGRLSPLHANSGKFKGVSRIETAPPVSPLKGSREFSKHVDDLDIKPGSEDGTVFLASSRQREWSRLPAGSSSVEVPSAATAAAAADIVASQQRIRRYSSDSNQSSESDGLDDHFVTSRGWIADEGDNPEDIKIEVPDPNREPRLHKVPELVVEQVQMSHIKITESQTRPSSSSTATSRRRRYGHQKSKSLGEILEQNLGEDIAKSQQVLEGVQLDQLSDSMILRSEMPKIRLELLDLDRFPAWNRHELEANSEDDEEEDEQQHQTEQLGRTRGGQLRDRNSSWRGAPTEPAIDATTVGSITTSVNSSHQQIASVRRATIEGSSVRFNSPIPPPFDPQERERASASVGGDTRMVRVSEPSTSSTISSTSQSSTSTSSTSPPSTITTSFIQRANRDFGTSSSWDGSYATCKEAREGEGLSATSASESVPPEMRAGSMATAAAIAVSPTMTTTTKIPSFLQGLFDNVASTTSVTSPSKPRLDRRSSKSEDGYGYDYGYLHQHLQKQRHQQSPTVLSPTAFSPTRHGFKDSDLWDFQGRDIEKYGEDEEEQDELEQDDDDDEEDEEKEDDEEEESEEDWDKEFQLDVQPTVRLSLNGPSRTIAHPLEDHHDDNDAYAGHDNDKHDVQDSQEEEEEEGDDDDDDDEEESGDAEEDESDEDESEEQDDEEVEVAEINWDEEERKVPTATATTPTTPLMSLPSPRATASTPLLLRPSSRNGKDSE